MTTSHLLQGMSFSPARFGLFLSFQGLEAAVSWGVNSGLGVRSSPSHPGNQQGVLQRRAGRLRSRVVNLEEEMIHSVIGAELELSIRNSSKCRKFK